MDSACCGCAGVGAGGRMECTRGEEQAGRERRGATHTRQRGTSRTGARMAALFQADATISSARSDQELPRCATSNHFENIAVIPALVSSVHCVGYFAGFYNVSDESFSLAPTPQSMQADDASCSFERA